MQRSIKSCMFESIELATQDVQAIFGDSPLYAVGGSVRNCLLGEEPKDFDYATPLIPDEVERRLKTVGIHVDTTGKRFGSIKFKSNGRPIEITTFRTEKYDYQSRKPEVTFVKDISRELVRRDLSINAMAMRGSRIIDPFNGRADLAAKRLRMIGNPSVRLCEDPLRLLRVARLAAQLDFTVDDKLLAAMCKNAVEIMRISRDLWVQEMDKLLVTEHPEKGLQVLADSYLLKFMFPELWLQVGYDQGTPYHELTLWEHTLHTVRQAPDDVDLRWAALLHDIGKPYTRTPNKKGYNNYVMHDVVGAYLAEGIAARLKWSNARRETVVSTIRDHLRDDSPIRAADNGSKVKLPKG